MTKIIRIDGADVLLGTDNGEIRKVKIYDVDFSPKVGDEVEVYENDGTIIVKKKQIPKENNYNEQVNNYTVQNQKTGGVSVLLYISMIASIVACFLPLISISLFGMSYSINYVYNEGKVADGIFIIGIQILSIILLSRQKRTVVCILELIATGLFGFTVYNMFSKVSSSVNISIYSFLGVGFYILAISLVVSVILAFIHASKK